MKNKGVGLFNDSQIESSKKVILLLFGFKKLQISFARDSELNGVVWLMFAFCINKFMKNVRTHVCGTAKGRCCFPMKRKWKSAKPLEHGSAYLTQLQYIINLLCEKKNER